MKIISNSKYRELYKKAIKVYLDRFLNGYNYGLDYELNEAIVLYKIQGIPIEKILKLRNEEVEEIKKIYNSYSPVPHEMVAFYASEIELIKQIGDFLSFSLYNFLKNNFIYIYVLHKSENKLIIELEFRQYAVKRLTMEKYSVGSENAMYRCIEVDGELTDFITFRDDLLKYLSNFLRAL